MPVRAAGNYSGQSAMICNDMFIRSFAHSLRAGVQLQPILDPIAKTFISVQCASPGKGGELVGVCDVYARCVMRRREQLIVRYF